MFYQNLNLVGPPWTAFLNPRKSISHKICTYHRKSSMAHINIFGGKIVISDFPYHRAYYSINRVLPCTFLRSTIFTIVLTSNSYCLLFGHWEIIIHQSLQNFSIRIFPEFFSRLFRSITQTMQLLRSLPRCFDFLPKVSTMGKIVY